MVYTTCILDKKHTKTTNRVGIPFTHTYTIIQTDTPQCDEDRGPRCDSIVGQGSAIRVEYPSQPFILSYTYFGIGSLFHLSFTIYSHSFHGCS